MTVPTKIQHPLARRSGMSQRKRIAEANLLRPELAPVDGRKLEDILDFVHEYARLVVFHEHKVDAEGQGYVELSNWLSFFEGSLPFILNRFAKIDFDRLDTELKNILKANEQKPNESSLRLLLDFCYFDLIIPLDRLQQTVRKSDFERLVTSFDRIARTSLLLPLSRFIKLSNVAAKYFGTTRYDFISFVQSPWNILSEDLFRTDETVVDIPGGKDGAIRWLGAQVADAAQRFLVVQRGIAAKIPDLLGESIDSLGKRHEPHLGLLYTFLRLFEHFQGDLNALTQKHLELFYIDVLRLRRRGMVPDQAHLVFEPAKHLKSHIIKEGTLFKDGKDNNNADILFSLNGEIVIDSAKVVALKTMFLNSSEGCLKGSTDKTVDQSFVEGVYIAPIANSADGKGESFQDEQSKNWPTLGAKVSKHTASDQSEPVDHSFGRLGFILASPVLWLNEGKRSVSITIECDTRNHEDWKNFSLLQFKNMDDQEESEVRSLDVSEYFILHFSGEEGWFLPSLQPEVLVSIAEQPASEFILKFDVKLASNEPKVVFHSEEIIEEGYKTECPFPMVWIELKPEIQLTYENVDIKSICCLKRKDKLGVISVGLYHLFRFLTVIKVDIEVNVLGLKSLVVQNEESLQDVNSVIYPFGSRPKLHAEFFIGSKEVLCKHWKDLTLNIEWKEKPDNLTTHYRGYGTEIDLEIESDLVEEDEIKNESFLIDRSILEAGEWLDYGKGVSLFPATQQHHYNYSFSRREATKFSIKKFDDKPVSPLNVASRDAFIRLRLRGASFQHAVYPFALARYLSNLAGPLSKVAIKKALGEAKGLHGHIKSSIININKKVQKVKVTLK